MGGGKITAFADISRTNQADDPYMSKDMLSRLGPDWGGYAPDWQDYLNVSHYCSVTAPTAPTKCAAAPAPQKNADVTFTNGQILRNDDVYLAGDRPDLVPEAHVSSTITPTVATATTSSPAGRPRHRVGGGPGLPVQIRDTSSYWINRTGLVESLAWDRRLQPHPGRFLGGGQHLSAALPVDRRHRPDQPGASRPAGQPQLAQLGHSRPCGTPASSTCTQDTISLLNDALSIDFGFKSTDARDRAFALPRHLPDAARRPRPSVGHRLADHPWTTSCR